VAKQDVTDVTPEKGPKWREPFLIALAGSGNVLVACKHARVSRVSAYRHRAKYPNFRKKWDTAIEESVDLLEIEAQRRAVKGTDKAIWYQGKHVGTVKEYSDTLLIFLMKANRPEKYRDNFDLSKLTEQLAQSNAINRESAGLPAKGVRKAEPKQ
jgi:hypothetical protein